MKYDLVVIGGGAAGFYGGIQAAEHLPGIRIAILEKSSKVLSKVRISGGGRCNVTHFCFNPFELAHHYPRGEKQLKEVLKQYHAKHVVDWFSSKRVHLKAEEDGRMFPDTDSSETIIECFIKQAAHHRIKIEMDCAVSSVSNGQEFEITCSNGRTFQADKVLICVGGNPKPDFYSWIASLGHNIVPPVPSLFTFNDSANEFKDLMGVSVPNAIVRIATTKFTQTGPVLITHWGLSGPAVIKLSAWAATYLHERNYQFTCLVSWTELSTEEEMRKVLQELKTTRAKQRIISNPILSLPTRLWERLCEKAGVAPVLVWGEMPNKTMNRLLELLIRCPFEIRGKTTFKEEFVTCGGVDMKDINLRTMESKIVKGIYFAGEVLNIDGETGGFNFQSAWTTSYVAAKAIAEDLKQAT